MHDGPDPALVCNLWCLPALLLGPWQCSKAALLLAGVPRRLSVYPSPKSGLAIAQGVSGLSPGPTLSKA